MNEIQLFFFAGSDRKHEVRVVTVDGELQFVGKDVCDVLEYTNPSKAMTDHCKGVTKRYPLRTAGGMQDLRILTEADVLRLIVNSKMPAAERFERWVFEEVLPSIRKTGGYSMSGAPTAPSPLPDFTNPVAAARAWADAKEGEQKAIATTQQQAAQLEAQKPAVEFVGRYVDAGGSKSFREVCKLLGAKENDFRAFLLSSGIVYRLNGRLVPYQPHTDAGRFEIRAGVTQDEHAYAFNQTRFTPKGVEWIAGKWIARQLVERDARQLEA